MPAMPTEAQDGVRPRPSQVPTRLPGRAPDPWGLQVGPFLSRRAAQNSTQATHRGGAGGDKGRRADRTERSNQDSRRIRLKGLPTRRPWEHFGQQRGRPLQGNWKTCCHHVRGGLGSGQTDPGAPTSEPVPPEHTTGPSRPATPRCSPQGHVPRIRRGLLVQTHDARRRIAKASPDVPGSLPFRGGTDGPPSRPLPGGRRLPGRLAAQLLTAACLPLGSRPRGPGIEPRIGGESASALPLLLLPACAPPK